MERYFGVRGKARVQRILNAVEVAGGIVLEAPDPSIAPFEFRVKTPLGDTLHLICYAFTANEYGQGRRPPDEHRLQVKYGSEFKRPHEIYVDSIGAKTTLLFGVHDDLDVFIAVDPAAHNPTWFSSSIEFKGEDAKKGAAGWHYWERDRMLGGRRQVRPAVLADFDFSTEVLIAFNPKHFLTFARFERLATGMEAGERAMLAERVRRSLRNREALDRLLTLPSAPELVARSEHPLLAHLGLSGIELLDTLQSRFRLMAAVRGSVAEVHLRRELEATPGVSSVEHIDLDGQPDFLVRYKKRSFRIECKNVLRSTRGKIPRVDFQKTRASKSNPCSRYYDAGQFEVLAACLHPITESWEFRFCSTAELPLHPSCNGKLSTNVQVAGPAWHNSLPLLLNSL